MYGFIHCCLEDLVVRKFGADVWQEILKKSGVHLRGASFLIHKVYTDEVTLKLVVATSEVLGLPLEACLEAFGQHFLFYCQQNGYDQILRVLGSNLHDFLTNLDNLHDHLGSIYPGMRAPSFRVTKGTNGAMNLHYYSERKGLHDIVRGLVMTVSKEFFQREVTVSVLENQSDDSVDHVVLEVRKKDGGDVDEALAGLSDHTEFSTKPEDLPLSAKTFCNAFPFHVMFRRDFTIVQSGRALFRTTKRFWLQQSNNYGSVKFTDLFVITRPVIECTFESILHYCNQVFVVRTKNGVLNNSANSQCPQDLSLRLKGQMVSVPESDSILFLCSPRVTHLEELQSLGLFLSDFPVHDRARDLLLMFHHRRGERDLVEKLDEATNHLRVLENRLRIDKKRTEELLYAIFPSKVAQMLCDDLPVPAERYETISCLFSDIVGFTALCSNERVQPMDIVRLLNRLYIQFDSLTGVHNVYKVETIGDAYIVVAGMPEFLPDHADRVVAMGLGMVAITHTVKSPIEEHPIRMRIGIHSGYVLAGVVGLQMPRYCLFGNTVTLANKMESNSQPDRVNISEVTKEHLTRTDYTFEENTGAVGLPYKCYFICKVEEEAAIPETLGSNLVSEQGHFRSPTGSPVHSEKGSSSRSPSILSGTPLPTPLINHEIEGQKEKNIVFTFPDRSEDISAWRPHEHGGEIKETNSPQQLETEAKTLEASQDYSQPIEAAPQIEIEEQILSSSSAGESKARNVATKSSKYSRYHKLPFISGKLTSPSGDAQPSRPLLSKCPFSVPAISQSSSALTCSDLVSNPNPAFVTADKKYWRFLCFGGHRRKESDRGGNSDADSGTKTGCPGLNPKETGASLLPTVVVDPDRYNGLVRTVGAHLGLETTGQVIQEQSCELKEGKFLRRKLKRSSSHEVRALCDRNNHSEDETFRDEEGRRSRSLVRRMRRRLKLPPIGILNSCSGKTDETKTQRDKR